MTEIEPGLELLCRERGAGPSGKLKISSNNTVELQLVSFEGSSHLNVHKQRFEIELEDGQTATLLNCYPIEGPSHHSAHPNLSTAKIGANMVVLGPRSWPVDADVASIACSFTDAKTALYFFPKQRDRSEIDDIVDFDRALMLQAEMPELSVGLGNHAIWGGEFPSNPWLTVSLNTSVKIDNYLPILLDLMALFSLSIGHRVRPAHIHLLPKQAHESTLDGNSSDAQFAVRHKWSAFPSVPNEFWVKSALCRVMEKSERRETAQVISAWMTRRTAWRAAYQHIMGSLKYHGEMSHQRLMAAFGWFEAIPLQQKSLEFTDDQVKSIQDGIAELATSLNPEANIGRVTSLVGKLKEESLPMRIRRLIATARERFGEGLVTEALEKDCLMAVGLRGKAAHGGVVFDGEDFEKPHRATLAMEAASFLVTIRDLPVSAETRQNLRTHPCLEYLRRQPFAPR